MIKMYVLCAYHEVDGYDFNSWTPEVYETRGEAERAAELHEEYLDEGYELRILEVSKEYRFALPKTAKKVWQEISDEG